MYSHSKSCVFVAALGLGILPSAAASAKSHESTIYEFKGGTDGRNPQGPLIADLSGALYGTTSQGGGGYTVQQCLEGCGTVYKLTAPSGGTGKWGESVLYRFQGTDGYNANSGVTMDSSGVLYGETYGGGTGNCPGISGGCGVVFRLTPPKKGTGRWTQAILHTFTGDADGASPNSGVMLYKGSLIGTTWSGGLSDKVTCNCGVVYMLTPPKSGHVPWVETILYRFGGGADGALPQGGLIADKTGAIYGGTYAGGGTCSDKSNGCGTVYRLAPPKSGSQSWTETVLQNFTDGTYGGEPYGPLALDPSGDVYGTAEVGGDYCLAGGAYGCGIAFELTPPKSGETSWTEIGIHKFEGPDGVNPVTGLVRTADGTLYGATPTGQSSNGVVYSLAPPKSGNGAWTDTVFYSFGKGAATPGLIAKIGSNLYGAAADGGSCPKVSTEGCGVVFEVVP